MLDRRKYGLEEGAESVDMKTGEQPVNVQVDVGICTFRRSELANTLQSLFAQELPSNIKLRLIVADNDELPSAAALVDSLRKRSPFEVSYVHCPMSNISLARNACLDESSGAYLAFIDDDETAGPTWIASLLETAIKTRADVVLGPVKAIYAANAPAWMKEGDFHSTQPVWVNGQIKTGYTCNVLLNMRSRFIKHRRFDLALGQSGGEDTAFFANVTADGGCIAFAPQAMLEEPVPAKRASLSWLIKRRFRSGQTHGRLLRARSSSLRRIKELGVAGLKAVFCLTACAATVFSAPGRTGFLLRAALHFGAVGGLLGLRELRQYGSAEAT